MARDNLAMESCQIPAVDGGLETGENETVLCRVLTRIVLFVFNEIFEARHEVGINVWGSF